MHYGRVWRGHARRRRTSCAAVSLDRPEPAAVDVLRRADAIARPGRAEKGIEIGQILRTREEKSLLMAAASSCARRASLAQIPTHLGEFLGHPLTDTPVRVQDSFNPAKPACRRRTAARACNLSRRDERTRNVAH